jgi:hypothetical protein
MNRMGWRIEKYICSVNTGVFHSLRFFWGLNFFRIFGRIHINKFL